MDMSEEPRLGGQSARRWMLIACAVLALGLAASLTAALLWHAQVKAQERTDFHTTATNVGDTVQTLLRRDTDLVATFNSVLTIQPHLSQSAFDQWYGELEGWKRQASGFGTTIVSSVPAAQLGSFLARRDAEVSFRALVNGRIQPVSRGSNARYCLLATDESVLQLTAATARTIQGDWCQPSSAIGATQAPFQALARDSGQLIVFPDVAQGVSTTFLESAFYRSGAPVSSVAQLRAALSGWVVSSFDLRSILKAGLGEGHHLSLAIYHTNPGRRSEPVSRLSNAGNAQGLSMNSTLPLEGQWSLTVRGAPPASGISSGIQALLVFIVGAILSALLAALLLVLSRSRARALALVEEKTGQLRHQALHDSLTGLANRVLTLDRAEQMLARARRQQLPVAALYVDVDGFKKVNDTFGHAAGDELLRTVAGRLRGIVREGDTAGRLGSDEFVILVEGATLDAGPELVAERVLEVLRQPYDLSAGGRRTLSLTVSVGVATGLREDADQLLRAADLAMYEAKSTGRNRYVLFQSDMHTVAQDRMTLEMDLSEALEREQFFLLYQPTFDLDSERVIGVEALLRWRHPTRGVIPPDEFIPLAEKSGAIVPIGRWVLEEACRQASGWQARGLGLLTVAVNVSGRQLDSDALIGDVQEALAASRLDPAWLTLEVTETALMADAEASAVRLRALKELGVQIAYSSLAYLRQFPADSLKIDRSFVKNLDASGQSRALVHTLVELGRTLGLHTLAEGIEDEAQLRTLQREHCEQGQGFLFSRPLDLDALEDFINAGVPPVAAVGR
jgi:diguanylate cyclase (GGDEF)-like protein